MDPPHANGHALPPHTLLLPTAAVAAVVTAVFLAERDRERFALYARKAALDERAAELRAQLKVGFRV